ncbi:hypothetical protein COCNU_09G003250 [Cocos nucifera]|uniref:Uncharacterized protein n=1 Tax=Cocos nucifera TaxID=13894 RepID=A0A8K0IJA2_COCNU|nr:hypothetical protein COCNU_09G003250 [Cocos nucifera]
MLNNNRRHNPGDHFNNLDLLMGYQIFTKYSGEGLGWATDAYGPVWKWNDWVLGHSMPLETHARYLQASYYGETGRRADISAGCLAAQTVSSLRITEKSHNDQFGKCCHP